MLSQLNWQQLATIRAINHRIDMQIISLVPVPRGDAELDLTSTSGHSTDSAPVADFYLRGSINQGIDGIKSATLTKDAVTNL